MRHSVLSTARPPSTTGKRVRRGCLLALAVMVLLVLGWFGWGGWVLWVHTREELREQECRENMYALSRAMQMYLADNNQAFPPANAWSDRLAPYVPDTDAFVCPSAREQKCGYALSRPLGGMAVAMIDNVQYTIALFESDAGWNAAGGPELLPQRPRHSGGDNYGFADGRSWWIAREGTQDAHGRWQWERETDSDRYPVRWEPTTRAPTAEG